MEDRQRSSNVSRVAVALWTACCAAVLALWPVGCSSSREGGRGPLLRVITPQPPAFLIGPASMLLTNGAGFDARVEMQAPSSMGTDRSSSGQLLSLGTKLLYAPEGDESAGSQRGPGGYSFIWDVAESRGYVLSEALQGYAPLSSGLRVTNISTELAKADAQRLSGHPCEPVRAVAWLADGSAAGFELWRAIDLNGLPVRIESPTNTSRFTLNLSKVRLKQPPPAVFAPPDGFTRYATPEAMADELAARQRSLRRSTPLEVAPMPDMERGRY